MKFDQIGFAENEMLGNQVESSSSEINHCVDGDPVNLCWIKHGRWKREHVLNRVRWSVWCGGENRRAGGWTLITIVLTNLQMGTDQTHYTAQAHYTGQTDYTGQQTHNTGQCVWVSSTVLRWNSLYSRELCVCAYNLCWPADRLIIPANNGWSAAQCPAH